MNKVTNQLVIQATNLSRGYPETSLDGGQVQVLSNCNLSLASGELLAIVGASGSGKSTLLHLLGGLDRADSGEVSVDGQSLSNLNENELAALRNHKLGFVYQFHHLLAEFSAQENVAMPLILRRVPRTQALAQATEILNQVGLGDRLQHVPGQMSGGERQRVAIARALVTKPRCVLADEPTGNLDRKTAAQVFEMILELNRKLGIAFILVTHDIGLAQKCHRVLQMQEGRLQ